MITANQRTWIARGGRSLVPDGSELASIFLAREGQRLPGSLVAHFENAAEFFDGLPANAPAIESEPDKPRRGRPPKA